MEHEIITLKDVKVIGISKEIAFNKGNEECPKFWQEYVETLIKPVVFEGKEPNAMQKAAFENNVGEFALCQCTIPNHCCLTCGTLNFTSCNKNTFKYVICGQYKGGDVPEGLKLYPVKDGRWLKIHFEGGMKAFQQQYAFFHNQWIKEHPEYKCAHDAQFMEWYCGNDIQSPDYKCGIMMPLED